ncbi:MAG: FAD-dependent oxidoreductase [Acidobacteria bacterium]|nr:FAD-dependent oxidoreductase [Acidobacteriota bacterium]
MHDVIIIGAGAAGLSAALWCDELGLDTLVLEQGAEVGGQLLNVHNPIGNYPGVEAANGTELRDLFAAQVAATVTLVHRGKTLGARREFAEKIQGDHRITVFNEATLEGIFGGERVEAVEILRRGALKPFRMAVRGVLVRVGVEPNAELFAGQAHTDERGYLVVSGEQETSVENVFAAGDISNPLAPTVSGACGAGATAAKIIASRLTLKSRES